eukprot:scaffold24173_cov162-Cylindrotheca_fusiformis.AAC.3
MALGGEFSHNPFFSVPRINQTGITTHRSSHYSYPSNCLLSLEFDQTRNRSICGRVGGCLVDGARGWPILLDYADS